MVVGPKNLNPRFFKSFAICLERSVDDGTSLYVGTLFIKGFPSKKCQKYWDREPNASWSLSTCLALFTVASRLSL